MFEDEIDQLLGRKKKVRDMFTRGEIDQMRAVVEAHPGACRCRRCMTIAAWDFSMVGE